LVEAAHDSDSAVYGMVQPYSADASTGATQPIHATSAHIRAAAANYRAKGVDGLYAWFLPWPMGETEKGILSDMKDGDLSRHRDKHYLVPRNVAPGEELHYQVPLPVAIEAHETGIEHEIPFHIADDMETETASINEVILRMNVTDLVAADRIAISLNGRPLDTEKCTRDFGHWNAPYVGQWLTFHLETIRPETGYNQLVFTVIKRPDDLAGTLCINDVEIMIVYGPYKPKLNP
ncbi:MAG: hypothetical protein HOH43_05110, partial [Candidatus Latescibacteria bacterium]|nr:hypothetical protein [Candidatus Latescibacterota bacterium]